MLFVSMHRSIIFYRELYSSSKKGKDKASSEKSSKSIKGKGKEGNKSSYSRRDIEIINDADFLSKNDEETEFEFFNWELHSSSKNRKGKTGSNKSRKSGKGKDKASKKSSYYIRGDLEIVNDAEFSDKTNVNSKHDFFNRELCLSSKKGKGKTGSKKSSKSGKGKSKAGKRRSYSRMQ